MWLTQSVSERCRQDMGETVTYVSQLNEDRAYTYINHFLPLSMQFLQKEIQNPNEDQLVRIILACITQRSAD